ncbi:MAG TPA: alpha/beta hydrolase [Chryseosolibacter sp.]
MGNPAGSRDIIFSHGFGCSQEMWLPLIPYFEKEYRLILYDHVGAGKSDTSLHSYHRYASLHQYAYDLIEICETMQLRSPIFIGHSVGATIGALASIHDRDLFSNLILIAASPCYLNRGDYHGGFTSETIAGLVALLETNFRAWADVITPVIMQNEDRPELEARLNESFCATDPDIAKHFAKVTFLSDHRADMKLVTSRTLLLQCMDDSIAPLSVGKYLSEEISNSVLVTLSAVGHCPHVSDAAQTAHAIHNYLLEISGAQKNVRSVAH